MVLGITLESMSHSTGNGLKKWCVVPAQDNCWVHLCINRHNKQFPSSSSLKIHFKTQLFIQNMKNTFNDVHKHAQICVMGH